MLMSAVQRPSGRSLSARNFLASTALGCALAAPGLSYAQTLPTGGSVAAGSVAIAQSSATHMNITQSSQSAVVNWQGFSVGQGSSVNFAQPNGSSAILNRVTGSASSTIGGSITANGQVYLVNPNGIAITSTGTVNAGGGFVASTLGISDADFMSGKRTFTGNGASAAVRNDGKITVASGGYAALIGGTVSNSGRIRVPLGKVGLGSGEQATLDFAGDGFLQVAMPTAAGGTGALIRNSGSIRANGGSVIISAATAREAARSAINISGLVQARSIGGHSGSIVIGGGAGGKVKITGRVIATSPHDAGGSITVTGKDIKLKGAVVDASGATGGGNINIGGGRQGTGPLQHADTTTIDAATTIKADARQTGNGGNVVVWSDLGTKFAGTISAEGGNVSGNGGEAEVSGKAKLAYRGFTDLSAAHGSFGNLLISTAANVNVGHGDDSAINVGTLQHALAGANVTVSTDAPDPAGTQAGDITVAKAVTWSSGNKLTLSAYHNVAVNGDLTGGSGAAVVLRADNTGTGKGNLSFAAGKKVTATGGVLVYYNPDSNPAGSGINPTSYTNPTNFGAFQGAGTTITGYMLVNTLNDLQNMQNTLGGTYALGRDIDASATATWNSGAGFAPIGNTSTPFTGVLDGQGHVVSAMTILRYQSGTSNIGLIGYMSGSGALVTSIGMVGVNYQGLVNVGALVGYNAGGTVTQSYASGGYVTAGAYVGGLVGYNGVGGTVQQSYSTATVSAINGGGAFIGGLVGQNDGTVKQSYAKGNVQGAYEVGGLVGRNSVGGTVKQSYATGGVSGFAFAFGSDFGGLVGYNRGTVQESYAAGKVSRGYSATDANLGGLVGNNDGTVTTSYWDTATSGQSAGIGGGSSLTGATGLTTAQMTDSVNYRTIFAGFDFNKVWAPPANGLRPQLYGVPAP
jgi:filamentous hemagglutinin family protein